ncbi:MAG TPA: hypothetical protein VKP65_19560 [Rhodothermales bacterium]|nr:hypothetical protein [Rhodothermales bacterium]
MRTNYTLTLVALLLLILTGCTDASNPVAPDTDLRFTEDARSVSGASLEAALERTDEDKRGDESVLVAQGKFTFSQLTKRASSEFAPQDVYDEVVESTISFSVSHTMGVSKGDSGYLEFRNGDRQTFSVSVQHVQLNDDGSVSFDGRIMGRDVHEALGASWFFARATDGGETGDAFAYYLGEPTDEPAESAFTSVTILQGGIAIYQQVF